MPDVPVIPDPELVLARIDPIVSTLYHAVETGIQKALAYPFEPSPSGGDRDASLASHIVRHHARAVLRTLLHDLCDDFELDEGAALSPLYFTYLNFNIRILKAYKRGGLPAAGGSESRRHFYCQGSLFSAEDFGVDQDALSKQPLNLVVLWKSVRTATC